MSQSPLARRAAGNRSRPPLPGVGQSRRGILTAIAFLALFSGFGSTSRAYEFLRTIAAENLPFREVQVSDRLVSYFHQRMLGDAVVEKDYIVYQFDARGGDLLARKSHWRADLPATLPAVRVTADRAGALVGGAIESVRLMMIAPDSDIFPMRPVPGNPCWVVKSRAAGVVGLTLVDAVTGEMRGEGAPPPAGGAVVTGPIWFEPCDSWWDNFYWNATGWFFQMGYLPAQAVWPTHEELAAFIGSDENLLFYELCHGDYSAIRSGCRDGQYAEYTYATDVEAWIANSYKKLFAFIGSCDGQCAASDNSFSYELRKGSRTGTATIGYCGMSTSQCDLCWDYALTWQDHLFAYIAAGTPVYDAFVQANADLPACGEYHCMRFAGDRALVLAQDAGACCLAGACQVLSTDDCVAAGGAWFPGITSCAPDPCTTYPCCLASGECLVLDPFDCTRAEGELQADAPGCDPDPCSPAGIEAAEEPGDADAAGAPLARILSADALLVAGEGEARIAFEVGRATSGDCPAERGVRLKVHDVSGRAVRSLIDERVPAGTYEVRWDGRDDTGARVPTGVYFCRLSLEEQAVTRRITVIE